MAKRSISTSFITTSEQKMGKCGSKMSEAERVRENVRIAEKLAKKLTSLSYAADNPAAAARLAVDLSDFVSGADHCRELLLLLLHTPDDQEETLLAVVSDLFSEMRHVEQHIASSFDQEEALVERIEQPV